MKYLVRQIFKNDFIYSFNLLTDFDMICLMYLGLFWIVLDSFALLICFLFVCNNYQSVSRCLPTNNVSYD